MQYRYHDDLLDVEANRIFRLTEVPPPGYKCPRPLQAVVQIDLDLQWLLCACEMAYHVLTNSPYLLTSGSSPVAVPFPKGGMSMAISPDSGM